MQDAHATERYADTNLSPTPPPHTPISNGLGVFSMAGRVSLLCGPPFKMEITHIKQHSCWITTDCRDEVFFTFRQLCILLHRSLRGLHPGNPHLGRPWTRHGPRGHLHTRRDPHALGREGSNMKYKRCASFMLAIQKPFEKSWDKSLPLLVKCFIKPSDNLPNSLETNMEVT